MNQILNITINGNNVKGTNSETILDVARRLNIEIPTLCHDPRVEPYTSCYLCVVQVEGLKGLQPSCSTKLSEGMSIQTDNEKIIKARKTALDLLLSNHYADCLGPCKQSCPAGVDVQGYISLVDKGMYSDAIGLIKEVNPLPAICGRVCVRPCELACRRTLLDENTGVGIDYIKRFAADKDLLSQNKFKPIIKPNTGKRVAVIGAGPGGLSAAYFLQIEGHQVDIYESAPQPGGWLRYGIPEYRLPNDILDAEVRNITELGVNIYYNQRLGDNVDYKDLQSKYDAVVLAIGSQTGTGLGCEGDDAGNIFSGVDFLRNKEMTGEKYNFKGKHIAVVGGGNTAMDCCRTSIRCGADKVYIIYRRTEKEMPANPIEIHESKLEGVEYLFLTNPICVNKDKENNLDTITCIKMALGEPDASGRRRPMPVDGSEFNMKLDIVLAAIGQKTDVDFIDNINQSAIKGQLVVNKWGDIEANKKTLQTGIPSVFAAGDAVSGPATIIEAIAQAKIAANSCNQYLLSEIVTPSKKEFLSRKDNFRELDKDDFFGKYHKQMREEMPVMDAKDRSNFKEVELGYANADIAYKESQRCLECGCTEYFSCDLKKYASIYDAEQNHYSGEYKNADVDFRHPFIEIDNNKCILCARCVRICNEVVGAKALGLVKRGFDTFVAPSMGNSLQHTTCESCGLCISTCPTGAITENYHFKPGPIKTEEIKTICNYCSVGCSIILNHKNGFVFKVSGNEGMINSDGSLCKYPKFGYHYINDRNRITKPLLKKDGKFQEISFEEALSIINDNVKSVKPDENAFFVGSRLTNEEMYLIQKYARSAANTNNLGSFQYMNRGDEYSKINERNTPFTEISGASKIYLLGAELNTDNAVVGFMVNQAHEHNKVDVALISVHENSTMKYKTDEVITVKDYYYFIKAVNHYLLKNNLQNPLFVEGNCENFEEYKNALLTESYDNLVSLSGLNTKEIEAFATEYNLQINAIVIASEKELNANACVELINLAMLTGKFGKTSNGIIILREKNNSQGLFDMGIMTNTFPGGKCVSDQDARKQVAELWNVSSVPDVSINFIELIEKGEIKNVFIFGEDPIGCAIDKTKVNKLLNLIKFTVVQDYFMTETAQAADIILPSSMPFEIGGTFTNTQKVIQTIGEDKYSSLEQNSLTQLQQLLLKQGIVSPSKKDEILMEFVSLLPENKECSKMHFKYTIENDSRRNFEYGCDSLTKYFSDYFNKSINN